MILKPYQQRIVADLERYYKLAAEKKTETAQAYAAIATLPEAVQATVRASLTQNWVEPANKAFNPNKAWPDYPTDGLGRHYPRHVIHVPTGGGKTLLAVEAIRTFLQQFAGRRTGLVVWLVPSDIIYTQTVQRLRDRGHYLRQLLDQASGGRTLILEKGQPLKELDVEGNLVVLFLMIPSISRGDKTKEGLRTYMDTGGYEGFFPDAGRYDLHEALIAQRPNLDTVADVPGRRLVRSSLANVLRLTNPLLIVDEFHKLWTDTAKETMNRLNLAAVLGFSATPKPEMAVLSKASGQDLKEAEMIKLDLHLHPPTASGGENWQAMLDEVIKRREALETEAEAHHGQSGTYIRPIALIQAERTGKEQRGQGYVHVHDVREHLLAQGIPPGQIAVKSSTENDIEGLNLLSHEVEIRYILTRAALAEGWDCPFAYVLGIIPNASNDTSVTQLVGRVLRQPYAKKTGSKGLDESYVYFCKGQTQEVLQKITQGFKDEGLGDLVNDVRPVGRQAQTRETRKASVRQSVLEAYTQSLYLPVWVMVLPDGATREPLSFQAHIRPRLSFEGVEPGEAWYAKQAAAFQTPKAQRQVISIDLDGKEAYGTEQDPAQDEVNARYLTRRLFDVTENFFTAADLAHTLINGLTAKAGAQMLGANFHLAVSEAVNWAITERERLQEDIFFTLAEEGKLTLAVHNAPVPGYVIPRQEHITLDPGSQAHTQYNYYLYEHAEVLGLNKLELEAGQVIDNSDAVLWWYRNRARRGYGIQGWRKHKVYPDFIAAKKKPDGTLDLVYAIETKGDQLAGNNDSTYKKRLFKTMNERQPVEGNQLNLALAEPNTHYGFEWVEQSEASLRLQTLLNNQPTDV